jgi:hypothetical protein
MIFFIKSYQYPQEKINLFPEFTVIDSGGYKTFEGYDFSEVYKFPINHEPWDIDKYNEVLRDWPSQRFPAAIVSFDHGGARRTSINNQKTKAEYLFNSYKEFASIILLKASKKDEYISEEEIVQNISKFKEFDIIGFTEKELGNSFLSSSIARQR